MGDGTRVLRAERLPQIRKYETQVLDYTYHKQHKDCYCLRVGSYHKDKKKKVLVEVVTFFWLACLLVRLCFASSVVAQERRL